MKKFPKTDTPEVLCFSSMGNEPGLKTESRELTPAARAMRRREIDAAKDKNHKRQLLRSVPGEKPAAPPAMIDNRIRAAAQIEDMRKVAAKKPLI